MITPAESVAREFVSAINAHSVERLVALMAANHRFVDSLGNVVEGREKMRAGWAGYFGMVPDYSITVQEMFRSSDDEGGIRDDSTALGVIVMLGTAAGTYAPKGELKPENRWNTPVALRAQVADGLIVEWRVYADNEPIRELMRKA